MPEKIVCTVASYEFGKLSQEFRNMTVSWDGGFLDLDVRNITITISKRELEKMLAYLFQAFLEKGGLGGPSRPEEEQEKKFTVVDPETGQKYDVVIKGSRILSWKSVEDEKVE
jgi:hypothetical protein